MLSQEHLYLFLAILYSLDQNTKARFEFLVQRRILDAAFNRAIEENVLPDWFSGEFSFDSLYGTLHELEFLIRRATRQGWIRMDGTRFDYHLDETEKVTNELAGNIPMSIEDICRIAGRIQILINEEIANRAV